MWHLWLVKIDQVTWILAPDWLRVRRRITLCKLQCDIWDRKIRYDAWGLNISCVSPSSSRFQPIFDSILCVEPRANDNFNVLLHFDVATSFVGNCQSIYDFVWRMMLNRTPLCHSDTPKSQIPNPNLATCCFERYRTQLSIKYHACVRL